MFTKESFEKSVRLLSNRQSFDNIINESRSFNSHTADVSIFLSHSHYDMKLVKMARAFFESFGIKIYVDWADHTMPMTTCGETALKIKGKIQQNKFFIFMATDIALISKWCNWEIGYADNWKGWRDKMAILPISDNRDQWKGNEYLQIYPEIICLEKMREPDQASSYFIKYPNGQLKRLTDWLYSK